MIREETFMGELVNPSSPNISEQEAIASASFGKYDYDPGSRLMQFGGYGYNNGDFSRYTNPPPSGIGSMPAFGYGQPNPAIAWQQRLQQQQMAQSTEQLRSFIKPVGINGEFLPPADFEERLSELVRHYWIRQEEEDVERKMKAQQSYGYNNSWGNYNYYGTPYYSPYYGGYNALQQEVAQLVEEMKSEAREARIEFNKRISRLAHNIAKEPVDEDLLDERYRGKYVETPGYKGVTVQDLSEQYRLASMKPFDNSGVYQQFQEKVSTEFREIIPQDMGFIETFRNMGVVQAKYDLDEEKVRRKNGALLYDSNSGTYRYFVRAKAAQRYAEKHGLSPSSVTPATSIPVIGDEFPTLQESARLLDDGTLNITCNFGSHKGEIYSVKNSQERQYEESRERFAQFYNSIPGSIYLTNPNGGGSSG